MTISEKPFFFLKRFRADTPQDPVHDWLVLLILSMILFIGIIVWNVWAFDTVANGGVIGADITTSSPQVLKHLQLETIKDTFEQRAIEEAKYQDGTYRYVDPSQ